MEAAGLEVVHWEDGTAEAIEWFRQAAERQAQPSRSLSLQLVMGPAWPIMIANQARNLAENRVSMIKAVLRKRV